ncbi:HPP family protein [Micromonospora zamorensis]|uniref:HPP family protein n=1 Tax=Micromonospora zamorensis TaxID=709883 RepID=UPI0033B48CE6
MGLARQSAHAFVGSALAVVIAGLVALVTHQPWLFPSLGPAVMLHVEKPRSPEASPRNTFVGHAVALLAGTCSWWSVGSPTNPPRCRRG